MSALLERLIVGAAVVASALYAFKALAPFRWRVSLARRLSGRLPDAVLISLAGQSACHACGPRPAATPSPDGGRRHSPPQPTSSTTRAANRQ